MANDKTRPQLRILQGGRTDHAIGSLRVMIAPPSAPPFPIEAEIKEEDTWLVMSAAQELSSDREHVIRVMTEALDAHPLVPGQVLVKEGSPMRLMVVVHDFDQEPSCRQEWIHAGLKAIFRAAEARQLRSISLPLIGTRYGPLDPEIFLDLLERVLTFRPPIWLRRLWLVVPEEEQTEIRRLLVQSLK